MPSFSTAEPRSIVKKSTSAVSSGVGCLSLCKLGSGKKKNGGKNIFDITMFLLLTSIKEYTVPSVGRKPVPFAYVFTCT